MPDDAQLVPSTPNPATPQLVYAGIRAVLIVVGVLGFALPPMFQDAATLQVLAGALSTLVGLVLEAVDEIRTKPAAVHAAATASAAIGRPVQPAS